jgi:hypothetical protein
MGYLTQIVIHNDALHAFEKNPEAFGKAIFEGINKANRERKQVSVPFEGYCNYIDVEPSRHADHDVLFLASGNGMIAVGEYEKDWQDLVERRPDLAKGYLDHVRRLLKGATKALKNSKSKDKITQMELETQLDKGAPFIDVIEIGNVNRYFNDPKLNYTMVRKANLKDLKTLPTLVD